MRSCAAVTLVLMLLLFGIPWLAEAPEGGQAQPEPLAAEEQRADADIALTVWDGQELRQMTMAEYLPGVVRGEMPAAFSQQALDAQAVAERTFICYHMAGGRKDAHPEADVCTSPACCSAYVSQEDAAARWGDKAEEYETKVQQAVRDTDGQIILYDGSPILAAFHSSSAGVTADSGDVWSSSLPYLHSVETPEGEDSVPNYYSVSTFSPEEFREIFLAAHGDADLSGDPAEWFRDRTVNDSGRVERVTVGGVSVEGTEVRRLFSLRSACFTVDTGEEGVAFRVTGFGHGVGMSQYGAELLARQGKTWQEIIHWYYADVTIGAYKE